MKMRCALLVLLGAWTIHAGAVPNEDRWTADAATDPWAAARSADDRSWYGRATGNEGSFSHKPAVRELPLSLEQPSSLIPEPSTWALFGAGLGAVALLGWRRQKRD